jgi:hypothetical protein
LNQKRVIGGELASKAREAFDDNAADVERLMEIHKTLSGEERGRRFQMEVLNKASVVLLTAFWESYCEDIASEALSNIVQNSTNAASIPTELKKMVAKELKGEANETAVWALADSNWKAFLQQRLAYLTSVRNRKLNTPKSEQIIDFFHRTIGLKDVSVDWCWKAMSLTRAKAKLDRFVELRGAIAHRGQASESCTKNDVEDYFNFIQRLVSKTGKGVNRHVKRATGKPLW